MSCRSFTLAFLRYVILILSNGTLVVHVANLVKLRELNYDAGNWWPSYTPYILYYVGPIVSILSMVLILIAGCASSRKLLMGDRVLSVINLVLYIAIIAYNAMNVGTVPWTGTMPNKQFVAPNTHGWADYCANYTNEGIRDRCWAQNGTLLGMVITGFLWLVLAIYSVMTRDSDVYRDEFDDYTNYRENVPMVHTGTSSPATGKQQQPHQNYFVPSKPAN